MSKKARSESARVASLIRANKSEYYISDTELDDPTELQSTPELIIKTLGKWKCAFMLICANANTLTVVTYVPPEFQEKIDAGSWLDSSNQETLQDTTQYINTFSSSFRVCRSDNAFKLKDVVRANGFKYLSDRGCLGEADSSDEYNLDDL